MRIASLCGGRLMGFRRSLFSGSLRGLGREVRACVMVVVRFAGGLARFTTGLEHGNEGSTSKILDRVLDQFFVLP